jgi:LuxR family maltose regulon positive regulatory protein
MAMAQRMPQVVAATLYTVESPAPRSIALDSAEWFVWLDDPVNRSFDLHHALGRLTVRKERRQRGGEYWVAYRRAGRRLRKVYLGKSPRLTALLLERAAARLASSLAAAAERQPHRREAPAGARSTVGDTGAAVLVAAKLSVPPLRPRIVRRGRLTQWLTRHARAALTLIAAPPGFGKTALLTEWHATPAGRAVTTAWVSLDAADNEPSRFWSYIAAALRMALTDLPPDRLPDGSLSTVADIINALVAVPRDVTLILDDYSAIVADAVHEDVAFLLDHLPPCLHIILTSLSEPPLPLARLRARGRLAELRAQDLRCTREEVADFVQRVMGLRLAPDAIDLLAECTEGWLAGLQLTALALHGHSATTQELAALLNNPRYIETYLAEEVLNRQSAAARRFLLETSLLDTLSGPLCDAATGGASSEAMLRQLARESLFLIPLDTDGHHYRYLHLFAQALRSRLRHAEPERAAAVCRRASAWYSARGATAEAVRFALDAGDVECAADLIEAIALPMIWQQGEMTALRAWLVRLPASMIEARVPLALASAYAAVYTDDMDTAERVVRQLEAAEVVGQRTSLEQAAGLAFLRASLHRERGDWDQSVAVARTALERLPESAPIWQAALTCELAHAHRLQGDLQAAEQAYETVARLGAQSDSYFLITQALSYLALVRIEAGRLHEAARCCHEAIATATRAGNSLSAASAGLAHHFLAEILYEWSDLEESLRHARQAVQLLERVGDTLQVMLVNALLVRLHLAFGDSARAHAIAAAIESASRPAPRQLRWIALIRARWGIMSGDLAAAASWAEALASAADDAHWGSRSSAALLEAEHETLVRLRLAESRYTEAVALAREARLEQAERGSRGARITLLALEALAHAGTAAPDIALATLGAALKLAEPENYTRLFIDLGAPMEALLRRAAAHGVARAYARRLLAAYRTRSGRQPTEQEFTVLRLVAAGWSNREIASHLVIAESTVKTHLRRVYAKLGAANRAHAIALAREGDLL